MSGLSENCIDLINNGYFQIIDPGPLHYPIKKFSVSRNADLSLHLKTVLHEELTSVGNELTTDITEPNTRQAIFTNPNHFEADSQSE